MSAIATAFLAGFAALFYLAGAVVLKNWSHLPPVIAVLAVVLALGVASVLEIEAMRRARFGDVVVLIIAVEVALACLLSRYAFAETYTWRDVAGGAAVLAGVILLVQGDRPQDPLLEPGLPVAVDLR
jgi:drug/metabolite transporter (DMT)-like permease